MTMRIAEASSDELQDWDLRAVDGPGGHVYQSRAWAETRRGGGWTPRFLVFADGFRLLSLERRWHWLPGGGAHLSRGPIAAGEPVTVTAERLAEAAAYLGLQGVDVVASDAQIEAATGYPALIRKRGFRPIEEIQPSRHRMAVDLPAGTDEAAVRGNLEARVAQRIRAAERAGLRTLRWDLGMELTGDEFTAPPGPEAPRPGDPTSTHAPLGRLYDMLAEAAERREFRVAPRDRFVAWFSAAIDAGQSFYLEIRSPDDDVLGGATFYRHGGRLSSAISGDVAAMRKVHRGVTHLLMWRGLQIAIREGRSEMDFDGADVRGHREEPRDGDEMYGLYRFKQSFGARWIELTGNHELVIRPARYALGRLTGRLASVVSPDRS